jgi:hypothetical protein
MIESAGLEAAESGFASRITAPPMPIRPCPQLTRQERNGDIDVRQRHALEQRCELGDLDEAAARLRNSGTCCDELMKKHLGTYPADGIRGPAKAFEGGPQAGPFDGSGRPVARNNRP